MPFFLLLSQGLYLKRKNPIYLALNKKWTTAFAITYAIGAVSGTVLTFGLGLFWPRFMDFAGPMIGVPLSIEVMFFLLEAIFLGIYLFGRDKLSPWLHWASAIPLFIGGFASMIVVILANSWMNTPVGFEVNEVGEVINVNVLEAMFAPAWYAETSHMTVAAFEAVAFAFAAVYAFGMLRGRRDEYHKKGLFLGMMVATLAAPLMIFSGDHTARQLAVNEPAKLAAIEPLFETTEGAGLSIGGYPDVEAGEVRYDIEIPTLLSVLSFDDPNATILGLNEFPEDERADPRGLVGLRRDDRNRLLPRHHYPGVLGLLLALPWGPNEQVPPGRADPLRFPGVPRDRARLDRDRGRTPALDRPGGDAGGRGFLSGSGHRHRLYRVRAALRVPRLHPHLALEAHRERRAARGGDRRGPGAGGVGGRVCPLM
jgi:cytochrome bd-type quinol oxidase subunit 1